MADEYRVKLADVIRNFTGILTPDVMRMFSFPKVTIAESYWGSFGSQAISDRAAIWCEENGIRDFVRSQIEFWFNDHEDAVLFKLRWG